MNIVDKGLRVRPTEYEDVGVVMEIYNRARARMRASGNMTQWRNGYPSAELVRQDIADKVSYVVISDKEVVGVFAFIEGEEPTYITIEGEWPDKHPYGTIHRIAGAPGVKGIADAALMFCLNKGCNIRVDTHPDNAPMLGWIAKRGFKYCGVIHVSDGSPRKAFQLG